MIRGNRSAFYSLPANRELGENPFEDFEDVPLENETDEYTTDLEANYYEDANL